VLIDCYLHHRDVIGADSAIIFEWVKNFIEETATLPKGNQYLLLILDGYSPHLQFRNLDLFPKSNIIVLVFPSHTSHELQPLEVTVFGTKKVLFSDRTPLGFEE